MHNDNGSKSGGKSWVSFNNRIIHEFDNKLNCKNSERFFNNQCNKKTLLKTPWYNLMCKFKILGENSVKNMDYDEI